MVRRVLVLLVVTIMLFTSTSLLGCEPVAAPLGSAQNPVKMYFVPSVEVAVIIESGDAISAFLKERTGLNFEVRVPTTYAAVVEEMGAAEADAMAFIPAFGYVLAHDKYGMDVSLAVVRRGWHVYWAEYLVRRDSDIQTLADLNGKSWAFPSTTSTSGYLVPASYFKKNGIEPGERVDAGGHPQAVIAVLEGSADFATVYYSPPVDHWQIGDPPEPETGEFTYEESGGSISAFKGGVRLQDARIAVLSTYPKAVEDLRILALSDPIPNDTVSFAANFPADVRQQIIDGLIAYAATEEGQAVLSDDKFYAITGFTPVDDAAFDPIRDMITGLGMTEEDILK
ncbi:MAG: phosphate/phosphite/phosphonate ABC transporter substrate-binding protein [Chloroflexi bacterium]|nr:phosphate/phosphite/phosphonate ABC transporter substrate-binding protein [Chloroflexota bacterium]